ncbi:MAG TPA: PEGA domain-containing protein [Polyangia bacterium]|nr:PEGA domain-containing protein [Polyangia bacterium]
MGPPEPPPRPPVAKRAEPAPPPVPVVSPAPAPAPPPAPDAATAVAEKDAAAPDAKAPVAEDDDTDDTNEEELLRKAVPNAEQAVIGADGAEPEKAAESKRAAPEASEGKRPAKPKHETAILHLKTVPVGAIVKTKGQVLGRTPINLHFRTGNTYELTFVKNGYELANRRVSVANAKDKTIALALKKRPVARKRSFFHPHR